MGWATRYIELLKAGETVEFRPRGNSMAGKIASGDLCTVAPLGDYVPVKGDVVLCSVKGNQYLHLVKAVKEGSFQIGNNRGGINGWTPAKNVYGILTKVVPKSAK